MPRHMPLVTGSLTGKLISVWWACRRSGGATLTTRSPSLQSSFQPSCLRTARADENFGSPQGGFALGNRRIEVGVIPREDHVSVLWDVAALNWLALRPE
jgi:hypothetical protein